MGLSELLIFCISAYDKWQMWQEMSEAKEISFNLCVLTNA